MNAPSELVALTIGGIHDFVERELLARAHRGSSVLDLGAGRGAWVRRLERDGYRPVAVDRNKHSYGADGIPFIEADLDRPFASLVGRQFDVITAIEVIEHLESPAAFLRESRALLAPGGLFLVTTPNIESVGARIRFLLTGELRMFGRDPIRNDPTHISPIHSALFERLATRAGLRLAAHLTDPMPAANRAATRLVVRALEPLVRGQKGNNCHLFVLSAMPS